LGHPVYIGAIEYIAISYTLLHPFNRVKGMV